MGPNGADSPARQALRLFLASAALRLAFLAVLFVGFGDTMAGFLSQSDGGSYLHVARRIYGGEAYAAEVSTYDSRVFPGWPLLFGPLVFTPLGEWGLVVATVLCASLLPVAFFLLTRERALSWLLCFFPPAWLLQTIHPMGEAAYLLLGLAGTLLLARERPLLAGLCMGAMFAVRPYALALGLGHLALLFHDGWRPGWRRFAPYALAGALVPAACGLLNLAMYGDLLHQLHAYGGRLADLNISREAAARLGDPSGHWAAPFVSVLTFPWKVPTSLWKTLYVYAHVLAVVALSAVALRRLFRPVVDAVSARAHASCAPQILDRTMAVWWLANSALIVCAGPYWGFHSFDRYFLWAWPAGLWLCRGARPRRAAVGALFLASAGLTAFALFRRFV